MRLTLSTLPQLAVLAKILCLLMVVMCGAVPSTVRSVSLYSTCNRGNVSVFGRKVNSTMLAENNAPYQKITTQSDDFEMKLYLFAEETKHYICFTKRWRLVGVPKNKRDRKDKYNCQFRETYFGRYLRYQSASDPTRFIGFNKRGKPMTARRGRSECYNFIKINPFSVDFHNELVASDRGGMKQRSLSPSHSRPGRLQQQKQQQQRSALAVRAEQSPARSLSKSTSSNYLIPPESSSRTTTTTQKQQQHHRHRHWRTLPNSEADVARRRHRRPGGSGLGRRHGSHFVEDKY